MFIRAVKLKLALMLGFMVNAEVYGSCWGLWLMLGIMVNISVKAAGLFSNAIRSTITDICRPLSVVCVNLYVCASVSVFVCLHVHACFRVCMCSVRTRMYIYGCV